MMKLPSWRHNPPNQKLADELAPKFGPLLATIMSQRTVTSLTEAEFRYDLLPPALFGIEQAVELLEQARVDKKKVVISADYDCDGATACSVLMLFGQKIGVDIDFVVPDRKVDGYGLSPAVVDKCLAKGAQMIVTVDNGTMSFAGLAAAKSLGVPVIVTDHHLLGNQPPDAAAFVNPQRPECSFSSKHIAGVGVAFYVAWAWRDYLVKLGRHPNFSLDGLLPLVALGTMADVVRLDSNNRALIHRGLIRMRNKPMPWVMALLKMTKGHPQTVCSRDLAFGFAPRLNAAGRLADMSTGIKCLLAKDMPTALHYAQQLEAYNKERKNLQQSMFGQALETLPAGLLPNAEERVPGLVVWHESFHEGVIGIVAGRLKERFNCPTWALAPGKSGFFKGSGRSIPGFHLKDALELVNMAAPDALVSFGGHAMAAGLTVREDSLDRFKTAFVDRCAKDLPPADSFLVDASPSLEDLTPELFWTFQDLIWGQGFLAPTFHGHFEVVKQEMRGPHLKCVLCKDGIEKQAWWFFAPHMLPEGECWLLYGFGSWWNDDFSLQVQAVVDEHPEVEKPRLAASIALPVVEPIVTDTKPRRFGRVAKTVALSEPA